MEAIKKDAQDFYRKVDTMSWPKLTMKIVGDGLKAKVIFDLLSTYTSNHYPLNFLQNRHDL